MYVNIGKVTEEEFFEALKDLELVTKTERRGKQVEKIEYYNVPASFDIETSSFTYNEIKMGCMYIWQFGINGRVVTGRTWEEYELFMNKLTNYLDLSVDKRLPVYVRNLSFEFRWIKDRFKWHDIFAREEGVPFKACSTSGIEFRCSYALAGCSLETTGKNLVKYKVEKMVGDLDYTKLRSSRTPLSLKEIGYCIHDCLVDMSYIQEEMEQWGDVTKIPMTATGKVRLYCREHCFSEKNKAAYKGKMSELKLLGKEEYDMLKRSFTAGFTHANWQRANEVWTDVFSMDFTSSYPTVMLAEKMPMSRGEWVKVKCIDQIENMAKDGFYLIFNIRLENLKEKRNIPDHYLSISKCYESQNVKADNGRLISADHIALTITSDDWDIIKKVYTFDPPVIGRCLRYRTDYLPAPFLECVLHFYKQKTTLKDVEGMEIEYQLFKGFLNSCFGMAVTDIVNDEIDYLDEWITDKKDVEEAIEEYNKSKNRFLFYPWGIAICSKARKNLWSGILELGQDYLYSDTDSVKFTNYEDHKDYFERYNKDITEKLRKCCAARNLNFEDTRPKTVKGKEKPLGVWDIDCPTDDKGYPIGYRRFKTLGAKRYLVEDREGHIKSTIAGLSKKKGGEFIASQEDPFEFFSDYMHVDEEHSGRLIATPLNEPYEYEMIDYMGQYYRGKELSGICLSPSDYNLKLSPIYAALLGMDEKRFV